jgi:EmrB/QacA subfamily drug resistance transporter
LTTEPRRLGWVRERPDAWRFAVATVCIGAFMGQLDASIVTVAIPSLQRAFGVSVGAATWVGLAYLVVLVSLVAAVGRLSDLRGRKLTYLYGFVVFTVGSAACALAPSLDLLVVFRVVQGLGAAMLQANSVAIIALAVPRERLGRALGIQGAAQALGLAAGPSLGGLLVATGGWRLIFLVNVPAGIVAFGLGWFLLPRSTDLHPASSRFDVKGVVLLAPSVAAVLCALTLGASGGLDRGAIAALVVVAGALVWMFVRHERATTSPLVDLALLASNRVASRLVAAATSYVVLFGTLLAAPFLLERGLHLGAAAAGCTLAALPVALGLTSPIAGRAQERGSRRWMTTAGMGLSCLALVAASQLHGTAIAVAGELAVLGIGIGLFTPSNNAALMGAVPRSSAGGASGLLNMSRGLGTAVGLAITSLVLALTLRTSTPHAFAVATLVLAGVAAGTCVLTTRDARSGSRNL